MKIEEKHVYQCDLCGSTFTKKEDGYPIGWQPAELRLGGIRTTYLICSDNHGKNYKWKERELRTIFQKLWKKITSKE